LDGAKEVKLFGETITVNAEIARVNSISSHADDTRLIKWVGSFEPKPTRVFVNHGDENACETLAARLVQEQGQQAVAPYSGDVWDLVQDVQVEQGSRRRITRKAGSTARDNTVFGKLAAAGQRLLRVIEGCRGRANKDLAKFTAQIHALCDKWEK
jgi:metallo-beta-lactamase family protein